MSGKRRTADGKERGPYPRAVQRYLASVTSEIADEDAQKFVTDSSFALLDAYDQANGDADTIAQADAVLAKIKEKMQHAKAGTIEKFQQGAWQGMDAVAAETENRAAERAKVPQEAVYNKISVAEENKVLESAARAGGKAVVEDFADNDVRGYIVDQDGTIHINRMQRVDADGNFLDSKGNVTDSPAMLVFKHEYSHFLQTSKGYGAFEKSVLSIMAERGFDFDAYSRELKAYYAEKGYRYSPAIAKQEAVASFVESDLFTNADFIDSFAREHSGLAGRALNWIQYQIAKNKLRASGDADAQTMLDAERLYVRAIRKAGAQEVDGVQQYAIERTTSGRPVAVIDTDILDGIDQSEWIPTVVAELKSKFPNGVTVARQQIEIDKQSREELTRSKYSKHLAINDASVFSDKLNAAVNANDVLSASTDYVNEQPNHARKDNIKDFARGKVLMRIGANDYVANVLVARTSGERLKLYDIVGMKKAEHTLRQYSVGADNAVPPSTVDDGGRNTAPFNNNMPSGGSLVNGNISDSIAEGRSKQYNTNINGGNRNGGKEVDPGGNRGSVEREGVSEGNRNVSQRGLAGRGDRGDVSGLLAKISEARVALHESDIPDYGLQDTDDHQAFSDALARMRSDNIEGGSVDPKTVEDLAGSLTFMSSDGSTGAAIQPNGNIVAVFKNKTINPGKRAGVDIILNAVARGGDRLDCYGKFLANTYAYGGMEPVARVAYGRGFNPEMDAYIDEMRAKGKRGFETDPDIYFMKLRSDVTMDSILADAANGDARTYSQAELDALPLMEYDDAEQYRDSLIEKEPGSLPTDAHRSTYGVRWDQYIKDHGAHEPGMQPRARDIEVPKRLSREEWTSQFLRSFLESKHVTDADVDSVKDAVLGDDLGVYTPQQNTDVEARVKRDIADMGVTAARKKFSIDTRNGVVNTDNNVLGLQLLAEASARGDKEGALDIAAELCIAATNSGRAVQVFAMLKKLDGAGVYVYSQKLLDRLNTQYAKQISAGKMKTISLSDAVKNQLLNARTEAEIADAAREGGCLRQGPRRFARKICRYECIRCECNQAVSGKS